MTWRPSPAPSRRSASRPAATRPRPLPSSSRSRCSTCSDRHRPLLVAHRGPRAAALDFVAQADAWAASTTSCGSASTCSARSARRAPGTAPTRPSCWGLSGLAPDPVETPQITATLEETGESRRLLLGGHLVVDFDESKMFVFRPLTVRRAHPNALRITAYDASDDEIVSAGCYSIGGGFVMRPPRGEPSCVVARLSTCRSRTSRPRSARRTPGARR